LPPRRAGLARPREVRPRLLDGSDRACGRQAGLHRRPRGAARPRRTDGAFHPQSHGGEPSAAGRRGRNDRHDPQRHASLGRLRHTGRAARNAGRSRARDGPAERHLLVAGKGPRPLRRSFAQLHRDRHCGPAMIVRDRPTRLELAFAIRGSIVPAIAPRLAFLMLFSAALVWLHGNIFGFPQIDAIGFTVFGIALSLFLGFRNNAAYDRWWEARKLWGGLLADLRSLAREVQLFVPDQARQKSLIRLSLAFIHLHRANLRKIADDLRAHELGAEFVGAPHPPCAALDRLSPEISAARHADALDGFGARALQERLASLTDQQARCERISTAALPYVSTLLICRTTNLCCLLLPFALSRPAGWTTPPFVGIVAYVFLGLAEVTKELSHPFGTTPNA